MKFEIYEPKNIQEKKPLKFLFRKDSDGDLVLECVDDFGRKVCNLFYFDNSDGGFIPSIGARCILQKSGYDTSFLRWDNDGAIIFKSIPD